MVNFLEKFLARRVVIHTLEGKKTLVPITHNYDGFLEGEPNYCLDYSRGHVSLLSANLSLVLLTEVKPASPDYPYAEDIFSKLKYKSRK